MKNTGFWLAAYKLIPYLVVGLGIVNQTNNVIIQVGDTGIAQILAVIRQACGYIAAELTHQRDYPYRFPAASSSRAEFKACMVLLRLAANKAKSFIFRRRWDRPDAVVNRAALRLQSATLVDAARIPSNLPLSQRDRFFSKSTKEHLYVLHINANGFGK